MSEIATLLAVKVLDLVTRQVVLDRTGAGPDGATLGTSALGVLPVAQAQQLLGGQAAFLSAAVATWTAAARKPASLPSQTISASSVVVPGKFRPIDCR